MLQPPPTFGRGPAIRGSTRDSRPRTFPSQLLVLPSLAVLVLLLLGIVSRLEAQQLTLKREIPGASTFTCPPFEAAAEPNSEERTEARRLASDADQAVILGDRTRAIDLLNRATELDPTSPALRYDLARALEEAGSGSEAITEYCRVLAVAPEGEEFEDSRTRLELILERERAEIPDQAVEAFSAGLDEAGDGRLQEALRSFQVAGRTAPGWPAAVYNRGLLHASLGEAVAAQADFQRYLELEPDAEDAVAVSQGIGQLRGLDQLPAPGTALTLGLFFPGAGQFYSGRPWGGLAVLTIAGGAVAAGYLVEEVSVRCVGSVAGDECPPDRVAGRDTDTPYLVHGLAAAGAVALFGAVESYFGARGRRNREVRSLVDLESGGPRVSGPELSARGSRLELAFVRVNF